MTDEIRKYFMEQYKNAKFVVVPGHWPDFQSQEEVDQWNDFGNGLGKLVHLQGKDRRPDDNDDF